MLIHPSAPLYNAYFPKKEWENFYEYLYNNIDTSYWSDSLNGLVITSTEIPQLIWTYNQYGAYHDHNPMPVLNQLKQWKSLQQLPEVVFIINSEPNT